MHANGRESATILLPGRPEVAVVVATVIQAIAVVVYASVADATITSTTNVAVPFIWINLALWGVLRIGWPKHGRRRLAAAVATGYVAILFVAAGIVQFGATATAASVYWLVPGWGPLVTIQAEFVTLALVPYRVIGYLALGVLVYSVVARTAAGALTGLLGVFSCVGCTFPLLVTVFGGLGGVVSSSAIAGGTVSALGTAVYAATVVLLVLANEL